MNTLLDQLKRFTTVGTDTMETAPGFQISAIAGGALEGRVSTSATGTLAQRRPKSLLIRSTGVVLNDGHWHHVALSVDGAEDLARLRVDGTIPPLPTPLP